MKVALLGILGMFLSVGICEAKQVQSRVIDLGVAGVNSDLQGAQYLSRIRAGFATLDKGDTLEFESAVLNDIEQRHLKQVEENSK